MKMLPVMEVCFRTKKLYKKNLVEQQGFFCFYGNAGRYLGNIKKS